MNVSKKTNLRRIPEQRPKHQDKFQTNATTAIPCILPNEFAAFSALLIGDMQFPKTYASWLQLPYRSAIGVPTKSVDVHSHEFANFCKEQAKAPSMDLLKEFAIANSI